MEKRLIEIEELLGDEARFSGNLVVELMKLYVVDNVISFDELQYMLYHECGLELVTVEGRKDL